MTFVSFARARAAFICLWSVMAACACTIAGVTGASSQAVGLIATVALAFGLGMLALDYARHRRFLTQLEDALELEHPWQAAALVDRPIAGELILLYDAIDMMGRAAAADVQEERRRADDYRAYVEAWVHEIKAPLAASQLMAARAAGDDGERLRSELDSVERQVEQALLYARSMSVASDYSIRQVDLRDVVNAVCRKNARLLIERGVTPHVEVSPRTWVFADEKWVAFVVTQAVVNAAQYGASAVRFTAERAPLDTVGEAVTLTVSDNGTGISAADVPRVFEPGFVGENGRVRASSTGMGLYLAAVMCKKMGLGLEIASEQGSGTRIMVRFPLDADRRDFANLTKA